MFCPQCGAKLPEEARFCHACGRPLGEKETAPPRNSATPPPKPASHKVLWGAGIFSIIVLIMLLGLALNYEKSKQRGEAQPDYFPLKAGMNWKYLITRFMKDSFHGVTKLHEYSLVLTNLPERQVAGKMVTPRRRNADNKLSLYYVGKDDTGIYYFAKQGLNSAKPIIIKPPYYYLKNPIQVGATWDVEVPSIFVDDVKLTLKRTIESKTAEVTVPAGKYKDCLKIKDLGDTKVVKGQAELIFLMRKYYWYAPGVGSIKALQQEAIIDKKSNKELFYYHYTRDLVPLEHSSASLTSETD